MDTDISQQLSDFRTDMEQRFSGLEQRFSGVEQRFSGVDQRFSEMDQRFSEVDQRFSEVRADIAQVNDRLDNMVDEMLRDLRGFIEILKEDQRNDQKAFLEKLNGHDTRLGNHEQRIKKLEKRKSA